MKRFLICLLCMLMIFSYVTVPAAAMNDGFESSFYFRSAESFR